MGGSPQGSPPSRPTERTPITALPPIADPRDELVSLLLVEDDEGDALLVEAGLEDVGLPVRLLRARTLAEARTLATDGIDCALLDLDLPDASGLDGLRGLRDAAPDLAVIVLTGLDDERRGTEALNQGAQDYLVKGSVDGALLARAIRYAVERRRAERSQLELREAQLQAYENARLERGLLPVPLVDDEHVRVTTAYRPGRRRALLGGDFYDAVQVADGTVHVMVGDVSGHSADEAALGVALRVAWRTLTLAETPQGELLRVLSQVLIHERHAEWIFATLVTVALAPDRRTAAIALAGHPPPLVVDGARTQAVQIVPSPPLGLFEGARPEPTPVPLGPGAGLLVYTDGLIEGRVGNGSERLGHERLAEIVGRATAADPAWAEDPRGLIDGVIAEVTALNEGDLVDDLAALLIARPEGA